MSETTAILAEDEPILRQQLAKQLAELWPELAIIAEADNGERALELANRLRPDCLFLDIRMPGLSGLEVAAALAWPTQVVFITAYDQYAVPAFEHEAVDYLLKPVTSARLRQTVTRLQRRLASATPAAPLHALVEQLQAALPSTTHYLRWFKVSKGEEVRLIAVEQVNLLQAEDKYITLHTQEGAFLLRKSLTALEGELEPDAFWRISRSTIVRVAAIERAQRQLSGGYLLQVAGLAKGVKVSRAYAHLFNQS